MHRGEADLQILHNQADLIGHGDELWRLAGAGAFEFCGETRVCSSAAGALKRLERHTEFSIGHANLGTETHLPAGEGLREHETGAKKEFIDAYSRRSGNGIA